MKIIKQGLQTSFQDMGRSGFMHQGVSLSGAMDTDSLKLANWLVGNEPGAACLEITLIGPTIEFEESIQIAICGAKFELTLNDSPIGNGQTFSVKPGDVLIFGKLIAGARAYLSFSARPELKEFLESTSTHLTANFGGFNGRALKKDDQIKLLAKKYIKPRVLPPHLTAKYSGNYLLRCTNSVETSFFEKVADKFFTQQYHVSADSNRMGIRLIGNPLKLDENMSIQSCGLTLGSIQIPPSGLPIISSVDGQTIGGYPRIANVISCDLSVLSQVKANDKVSFTPISVETARNLYAQKTKLISSQLNC